MTTERRHAASTATIALAALAFAFGAASAEPSRFDGAWSVTMTCPAHADAGDDAKGYSHRFSATVVEGGLSGTHGTEGEPGWHVLRGPIRADGSAVLRLDGIVNNAAYAIKEAPRGMAYSYRVQAQFDEKGGLGQRLTGRVCEFRFTR